ncbi:MutS-related protein [Flagellimonas allohymeniacidonis]|uniref:DNA mismatch repair protein MutS n=1 Tax=Flagellimonas allohymeniacidonis TaxID=2517819 RepID=A0A4Q8QH69_9FLAO|nr:DNA mismatch repair protein MutS [Allomuricauda hymeniacidonis]TAI48608.1 DNA mismatch repair protein MutS [Allomuricauda hymeniacidonis]
MAGPHNFYQNAIETYKNLVRLDKKALNLISTLRIAVFLLTAGLIYFFYPNKEILVGISILGIGGFVFLLRMYESRKSTFRLNQELLRINQEEIRMLNHDYLDRFDGIQFEEPKHFFSSDVDLFGRGSFFQYLNRTGLTEGIRLLADLMKSNDITDIEKRQQAIKELSQLNDWRQNYTAISRIIKTETTTESISKWLRDYTSFVPTYLKWVPAIFGGLSVILVSSAILELLNPQIVFYWFLFGLTITALFVRKVNLLSSHVSKIRETVQQYAQLLREVENQHFDAAVLAKEKDKIKSGSAKASAIFSEFASALDALDNRNNLLVALLGNGFFLWDLKCTLHIEKWIGKNKELVEQWFRTAAFFDAYNSMATFAFNHPDNIYPSILPQKGTLIEAKELGHPLIPPKERICSDVSLRSSDFMIITGANMAGKSTFLRSVSLFVVMANLGLPICAKSCKYHPIKLITSMRTTDSLTDNSSYFFAELTRLQFIVEELDRGSYLVVLDEILKGTNSVDKTEGSKKLIERLVAMGVPGIIATHDLSLCSLENELNEVRNYFFETEIKRDELHFDYRLKQGVCKNMNASFLLQKMRIVE